MYKNTLTHKLYYALTDEKRVLFSTINSDTDKAIYEIYRNTALSVFDNLNNGQAVLGDGRVVKFKIDKVDAVKIPLTPANYQGKKSVLVCSDGLYLDLINACKLDNYLRAKDGNEMISFNEFINNVANAFVNSAIREHRRQVLDKEMNQIRSETPNKSKK